MSEKIIDINHQIKDINSVNLENMVESCEIGPTTGRQRRQDAFQVRLDAAIFQRDLPSRAIPAMEMKIFIPIKSAIFPRRCRIINLARLTLALTKLISGLCQPAIRMILK